MYALLNWQHKTKAKSPNHCNMSKQLTCVCVRERCHKLQVLLHQSSLVHHSGTGGRHKGHGGSWATRCFSSEKGQTGVSCTHLGVISCTPRNMHPFILLPTIVLLNGCYFNILTPNADAPHYRRTVMTSFKAACDHHFFTAYNWKWIFNENSNVKKAS